MHAEFDCTIAGMRVSTYPPTATIIIIDEFLCIFTMSSKMYVTFNFFRYVIMSWSVIILILIDRCVSTSNERGSLVDILEELNRVRIN